MKHFSHFFTCLLLLSAQVVLHAQELPPIIKYTPETYHAENQNWAISQGNDKNIYIANNSGLLVFNGEK